MYKDGLTIKAKGIVVVAVKYIILKGQKSNVVIVGNFDVITQGVIIDFPSSGTWYNYVSGEILELSSKTYSKSLLPGEYHIYSSNSLN